MLKSSRHGFVKVGFFENVNGVLNRVMYLIYMNMSKVIDKVPHARQCNAGFHGYLSDRCQRYNRSKAMMMVNVFLG